MDKDAKYVFLFTGLLLLMLILDYLWIEYISKSLFDSQLKNITGFKDGEFIIRTLTTSFIYLLIGLSMLFFFDPSVREKDRAITLGAFIGALVFGVLEFSNYVYYNNYSPVVVVIDMLWGTVLFSFISFLVYSAVKKLYKMNIEKED